MDNASRNGKKITYEDVVKELKDRLKEMFESLGLNISLDDLVIISETNTVMHSSRGSAFSKLVSMQEDYINYHLKEMNFKVKISDMDLKGLCNSTETIQKYPFLHYVMQEFFRDISNRWEEIIELKEGYFEDEHSNDCLRKFTRSYFKKIQDRLQKGRLSKDSARSKSHVNFFDSLNDSSVLLYEGARVSGKMLLAQDPLENENINFRMKFKEKIPMDEHRRIRKLLEIADGEVYFIGDGMYFYGFGEVDEPTKEMYTVHFKGRYHYDINKGKEDRLVTILYGNPKLKKSEYSPQKLEDHIENIFKNETKLCNIDKLKQIINSAKEQKHGTMVVITPKAENEAKRMKMQSTAIEVSPLEPDDVKRITNIDGAILVDLEGQCHAIGVILDGRASDFGDPARGARYNSALRYANTALKECECKCVIVVISEDGMIDILPEVKLDDTEKILENIIDIIKKGNMEDAVIKLDILINKIKGNEDMKEYSINAFMHRGNTYAKMGDWKKAIKDYGEVIGMVSHGEYENIKMRAYNNRGICYLKAGDADNSIKDYDEVIRFDPSYAKAYYNRGTSYLTKEDAKKAIEDYSKAIILDPLYATAYYGRGASYSHLREDKRAIDDYDEAIRLDPSLATAYCNRGASYSDLGDEKRAIDDYSEAIRLDPYCAEAYYNRRQSYLALGDIEKAEKDYEKAINLEPELYKK